MIWISAFLIVTLVTRFVRLRIESKTTSGAARQFGMELVTLLLASSKLQNIRNSLFKKGTIHSMFKELIIKSIKEV